MKDFFKRVLAWFKSLSKPTEEPPAPIPQTPTTSQGEPPWIEIARKEIGTKEVSGSKHNPKIIEYHKTTSLKATEDEVPWCSSFVNWVFFKLGWKRTNSARAKSWADWGIELERPAMYCVVVYTRDGGGHVGFYFGGYKTGLIYTLGGNQSNQVKFSNYMEKNVIGYFWPEEFPLPPGAKVKKK